MQAFRPAARFRRTGRAYHLDIATAADLRTALDLDEAHWVATSAPVDTIHLDPLFLKLVDSDSDGRIKSKELMDAIRWCLDVLSDFRGLNAGDQRLAPGAINTGTEDGKRAYEAATKLILQEADEGDSLVSLEEVREVRKRIERMPVSAAGIVLPEATDDRTTRQFVEDLIATMGGAEHPSGAMGLDEAHLARFLTSAKSYLAWHAQGQASEEDGRTAILPLGAATSSAFAALAKVREKVDQYFAQCEVLTLDESLADRIKCTIDNAQVDYTDQADLQALLKRAPLSRPRAEGTLSFDESINPYYTDSIARLRDLVLQPRLGISPETAGKQLTRRQWEETKQTFASYECWVREQPGAELAPLGTDKLRHYLKERSADAVRTLIAESKQSFFVLDNIRSLEKLLLFQSNLLRLANNFVSFPDLYDPRRRAVFEMGTAILDGRRFNFAVLVRNRKEHAKIAAASSIYVMYLDLVRESTNEAQCVAVPVTAEGEGNLCVGKRGIFEDISGKQWDARIVQIIENPIGLGGAIAAPYRRLTSMFAAKIDSLTGSTEKQFDESAKQAMSSVSTGGKAAPAPPSGTSGMTAGGMLMGGGIALAALLSAVTYVGKAVMEKPLAILLGVLGAALVLMVPATIRAFLKLRRRDLSSILEGTGWAINARMRLTRRQALTFTTRPPYPKQARARRAAKWLFVLLLFVALAAGVAWRLDLVPL